MVVILALTIVKGMLWVYPPALFKSTILMQIAENPSLTAAITDFVSNAIVVGEETEQVAFNMVGLNK